MNRFLRPPINIQMNLLFSRQSSHLHYLANVIRSSGIEKQREKCSNVQIFTGATFPHPGTRVHYYIRENPASDTINTENTMAALLARLAINIIRPISIIAVLRRIEPVWGITPCYWYLVREQKRRYHTIMRGWHNVWRLRSLYIKSLIYNMYAPLRVEKLATEHLNIWTFLS